jgi:hypothetical protein
MMDEGLKQSDTSARKQDRIPVPKPEDALGGGGRGGHGDSCVGKRLSQCPTLRGVGAVTSCRTNSFCSTSRDKPYFWRFVRASSSPHGEFHVEGGINFMDMGELR